MYDNLQKRFRCGQSYGKPFHAVNGILQGCPLSVLLVNAVMTVWVNAVRQEVQRSEPQAYADDTSAIVLTRRGVQLVANVTHNFALATGQ
eukprot:8880516-Karenia_brevis.AAC.1